MSFELPDPPRDEDLASGGCPPDTTASTERQLGRPEAEVCPAAYEPYPPEVCSFIRRCLFRWWRWERVTQEWTGWRWRTTSREVLPRD